AALLVLVLLADLIAANGKKIVWACFLSGILVIFCIAVLARGDMLLLGGSYAADGVSWLGKIVIVIGTGLAGAVSMDSPGIREKYHGAYAALLLAASLGMMVLVSSRELVTMYVGLETSAVSLYGLAALAKKDVLSLEAGIKYLVVGALSSGVLLYGLALVYTATGTTSLDDIRSVLGRVAGPLPAVGIVLVLL